MGSTVDLGVLSPSEALNLLCSHRHPGCSAERSAAERIVELVECHPLAVEVAGSYLAQGFEGFEDYVAALENPNEDAVEFGQLLKESLPTTEHKLHAAQEHTATG